MAGGFSQAYANLVSEMTVGESYTPYNNANAYLGVGDGDTAFAAVQTDLQGSTTLRRPMEQGFPNRTDDNVVQFRSEFDEDDANFTWAENALFNHVSAGTMCFRDVENLGTKAQGTIWVFTKTVVWSQD